MVPEMFGCIPGERKLRDNCFIDAGVQTKKDTETGSRRDRMCWSEEDMVIAGGVNFGSRKAIQGGEFFDREVRKMNSELTVINNGDQTGTCGQHAGHCLLLVVPSQIFI